MKEGTSYQAAALAVAADTCQAAARDNRKADLDSAGLDCSRGTSATADIVGSDPSYFTKNFY